MNLLSFQQRVVEEHIVLTEKIEKLNDFIETSPEFKKVDQYDKQLMQNQLAFMRGYAKTLDLRIQRFI